MEKEKVNEYISEVVKDNIRHADYTRVTTLAAKYFTYYSGEGLDDELQQFTPREEEELFTQRKAITKHIVTSVAWNVTSVEKKVPRSNGITKLIGYKTENDAKLKELTETLNKFWGDSTWDRYMEVRWIELNDIDPNTFVVFEWGDFNPVKELLQPYPFEVDSLQAIDYLYKNNILQYLTVLNNITMKDETEGRKETKKAKNILSIFPMKLLFLPRYGTIHSNRLLMMGRRRLFRAE